MTLYVKADEGDLPPYCECTHASCIDRFKRGDIIVAVHFENRRFHHFEKRQYPNTQFYLKDHWLEYTKHLHQYADSIVEAEVVD